MRASFLLVLGLALLVGLGVAVALKSLGLLTPQTIAVPTQAPPPPPPVIAPPPPRPTLLVAAKNLFVGDTIRPGDVMIRPIRQDELEDYEKNKSQYILPILNSVSYRFMAVDIAADTPLKKSALKELAKPEALHARLVPGMRAVNVSIPKTGSAGGLIQVGDWVDLYVTTEVGRTDQQGRTMQTGVLVHHAQVIAKRDTLFTGFAPGAADTTTIQYTLAMNAYRAALLEFGRSVGVLSMSPVSEGEKKQLDELKTAAMKDPSKLVLFTYSDANSADYKAEETKVKDFQEGRQSVGSDDLIRVLNLKPIPLPTPPLLPPAPRAKAPPVPPITVELLSGTRASGKAEFPVPQPAPEPEPLPPAPPAPPQGRYTFGMPKGVGSSEPSTGGTAPQAPVSAGN
jgi:Flp pilus assembly protein CpaB